MLKVKLEFDPLGDYELKPGDRLRAVVYGLLAVGAFLIGWWVGSGLWDKYG